MKNYRITVNGNTYDVQVEELGKGMSAYTAPAVPTTPAPAAVSAPAPAEPAAPASAPAAGGTDVTSPMPGNILDIKVNVGDKVTANQVVVVLEAMKMENDIVTPAAGTVASINVTKGQAVNSGDVLITVAE
ncbi:MAG: biotin/lipoyl-containing protein [Clostridia bacterium]|nr:biotin/lipoyl-containing protein [Clostridia bacterium]